MGLVYMTYYRIRRFLCRHDYELVRKAGKPVGYQCRKCDNRLPYVRPEDLLE